MDFHEEEAKKRLEDW